MPESEIQRFLYAVSHDLQEPLRKIQTFGRRLAAKMEGRLDDDARADLDRILSAAERGQGMIEGLLILSRLETHAGPIVEVDLNETLAAVCQDLQEKISASEAVVSIEPLPKIPADADQLKLLFTSLVDNSLKFRAEEQTPAIRVAAEEPAAEVGWRIVVEDNGIGLDQQYADRVFTVFQRLHPRDIYPGLGLGLAYCRKIVERHGGDLCYEPTPEGGTRFLVTLPYTRK